VVPVFPGLPLLPLVPVVSVGGGVVLLFLQPTTVITVAKAAYVSSFLKFIQLIFVVNIAKLC
jgi:hypothetical protein